MAFRPPIARSLALSANLIIQSLSLVIGKISARSEEMVHLLENEGLIANKFFRGELRT